MPLLVTRPQPAADDWVRQLQAQGVQAQALPLIEVQPLADPQALQHLRTVWAALPRQRLVMFVSPGAVQAFFRAEAGAHAWPAGVWAGATGPGTAAALQAAGVPAAQVLAPDAGGDRYDSEVLWQQRLAGLDWSGQGVLLVRGDGGRDWLAQRLQQQGARVQAVQAYARMRPMASASQVALLQAARTQPQQHPWLFSSSLAIDHLAQWLRQGSSPMARDGGWSQALALCTHERIAETARGAGFGQVVVCGAGLQAVVRAARAWAVPTITAGAAQPLALLRPPLP
jgi:uroporphyrinogen-III synthase